MLTLPSCANLLRMRSFRSSGRNWSLIRTPFFALLVICVIYSGVHYITCELITVYYPFHICDWLESEFYCCRCISIEVWLPFRLSLYIQYDLCLYMHTVRCAQQFINCFLYEYSWVISRIFKCINTNGTKNRKSDSSFARVHFSSHVILFVFFCFFRYFALSANTERKEQRQRQQQQLKAYIGVP